MRILLMLVCLIILTAFGCKHPGDPNEFDRIVSLAYSNLTSTDFPDSTRLKLKKEKNFRFLRIKKDSVKMDSCNASADCFLKVM
ncbi:hypothetical protein TH53_13245 [Pedobacter lusitanus]|uniref:Lipoprotein n=2 Tax=Pedobacter lusitanus TaxID=1503925 RepID=A0A0D0GHN7_9SPHI|nr:hypothetical protein TH53_13245 [Pedobacter lusitanus]